MHFLLFLFLASSAFAELLQFGPTTAEPIAGVAVPSTIVVNAKDRKAEVFLTGAGIRTKKVVLLKVDVYVGANYLDRDKKISVENPMSTIAASKFKVMTLTFLRDIDNAKIRESFIDALKENGVDVEKQPYKKFLDGVRFDIKEKDRWTFVGMPGMDISQTVVLETPKGRLEGSGPGFADNFWKMWFAKTIDGGVEELKEKLVGSKQDK